MQENNQIFRNTNTAFALFFLVIGMVGLAFASEPLYRIFCQVTGYGGTTQIAAGAPIEGNILNRKISVNFDANVNSKLPWKFIPVQRKIRVRLGEQALAFYEATNVSDKPLVGTASFNITPYKAALHFNKIDCFCFRQQVLMPGETVSMPVSFFVDVDLAKDNEVLDLDTITLSYTFFKDEDQSEAQNYTVSDFELEKMNLSTNFQSQLEG